MFAPRYFATRMFAPRFFPPGSDVVVRQDTGGGGPDEAFEDDQSLRAWLSRNDKVELPESAEKLPVEVARTEIDEVPGSVPVPGVDQDVVPALPSIEEIARESTLVHVHAGLMAKAKAKEKRDARAREAERLEQKEFEEVAEIMIMLAAMDDD